MKSKIITKRSVEALKPGEMLSEGGFQARCLPSGVVTYGVRYRNKRGEHRRYTLGLHGNITPDQAETFEQRGRQAA
jgi:hypothetical protein